MNAKLLTVVSSAITITLIFSVISFAGMNSLVTSAEAQSHHASTNSNSASIRTTPFLINTDMGKEVVYFINPTNDKLVTVDLEEDPLYPGGMPLHTLVLPDGKKAYLTIMSDAENPASVAVLRIGNIDWSGGTADVEITKVIELEEAGSQPSILVPEGTETQPVVPAMWVPGNQQIHGPTIHPTGKYIYFTQWTDNKIRVIDTQTDTLAEVDPIQYGTLTRQIHGAFFNPAGTKALATGYYFDMNYVTLYNLDPSSGDLSLIRLIPLTVDEEGKQYAAFTHHIAWLDNRYAITGTQQIGETSLTPEGFDVIGPSVWLIDSRTGKAQMIIGPADSPISNTGIYMPVSDVAVVGNILYVGEEDSMDDEVNADGYVSVWDISDRTKPKFIKRLSPGSGGLPATFSVGHEFFPTPDGKFVYVQSWESGHLVKIDTKNHQAVKVYDSANSGFDMPHGGFVVGNIR